MDDDSGERASARGRSRHSSPTDQTTVQSGRGSAVGGEAHRIVVLGAESTGTTTLVGDLARRLGAPSVPEFLRGYAEERATAAGSIWDVSWTTDDFDAVAEGQDRSEDAALHAWAADPERGSSRWPSVLLCDTDALATAMWHRRYVGTSAPRFLRRAEARPVSLYVLTSHEGVDFEQDGLRDGEHVREEMTAWFRDALGDQDVPWIEVIGARSQRLEQAVEAIERIVADPQVMRRDVR